MLKKALLLICIIQLLGIIQSCCSEETGCYWKDFSLELIDYSELKPIVSTESKISKKAYGIRVNLIDSLLWENYATLKFTQEANATTCGQEYSVKKTIHSIQLLLTNSRTTTSSILDVTNKFKARETKDINSKYISLQEIITILNSSKPFQETANLNTKYSFDLYLVDSNNMQDTCSFIVTIQFDDNTIITHETSPVVLY